MMNKTLRIFLPLLLLALAFPANALTAAQILDKSSASLLKSKGITAVYSIITNGRKTTGNISAKGKKFYISTSGVRTWYDGDTQWNYNTASEEVTVSRPTAAEVATLSPYSLISSYKTLYNPKALTSKLPGTYAIQLNPKSDRNSVKTAIVYIRTTDFLPCRLDLTLRDGSKSTVVITSLKTNQSLADAVFKFPKAKYPKADIIDLR